MKEFIEKTWEILKVILSWLFAFLVMGSFVLNFWLIGIVQTDRDVMKDSSEYLRHRDSIQLELMDRITDKNNTVRK
jgi:hypothetical protein